MAELINQALVISLAGLMFAMGLALTPQDFRIVLAQPRVVAAGMASILFLLPAAALAIAALMDLPPALAVGLVLVGACPGGLFSNLMTTYARGDLALSICLTTFSSFCTLLTLPLAANLALALFVGETREVTVPVPETMVRIFFIAILPVVVGMAVRRKFGARAARWHEPLKNLAGAGVMICFLALAFTGDDGSLAAASRAWLPVLLLNASSVGIGFILWRLLRMAPRQGTALVIEHSIKQEGLGIYIALSVLAMPLATVPLLINSAIGLTASILLVAALRIWQRRTQRDST